MRKGLFVGALVFLFICGVVLMLSATSVYRCEIPYGGCTGPCLCTGDWVHYNGLCAFNCSDGGYCPTPFFPCKPSTLN
jgi:hypothetical protein